MVNIQKETPLIRASHNGHLNAVKHLISCGANVNAVDLGGSTALHWAAMRGHVEICKALLEAKANKNMLNAQGKAPIDLARPEFSYSWRHCQMVLA